MIQVQNVADFSDKIRSAEVPNGSHTLRKHRRILAAALKDKGLNHETIAKLMGWKAAATVGHKLRGRNGWKAGELERMCELAGMTLISLAAQSDDLKVTKRQEAVEGAAILDELPKDQLDAAMAVLRAYRAANPAR